MGAIGKDDIIQVEYLGLPAHRCIELPVVGTLFLSIAEIDINLVGERNNLIWEKHNIKRYFDTQTHVCTICCMTCVFFESVTKKQ